MLLIRGINNICNELSDSYGGLMYSCHPLAFFSYCLIDGCLPPVWRKAFITPIHKKGDSSLPSNYRPISLT